MNLYKAIVGFALLLLPDDRLSTRRAVMRAGALLRRGEYDARQRKRLVRGMGRGQTVWVGLGAALLTGFLFHPVKVLFGLLITGIWAWGMLS